jgi:hypothetical protein
MIQVRKSLSLKRTIFDAEGEREIFEMMEFNE